MQKVQIYKQNISEKKYNCLQTSVISN